tara:strand:+ start:671 stop:835 length:165 start_codon:yes stop_codon:yes gene_type:complete
MSRFFCDFNFTLRQLVKLKSEKYFSINNCVFASYIDFTFCITTFTEIAQEVSAA